MHKLRTPLARPSLDMDLLSHSHYTSALLAWGSNGTVTGSPGTAHPSRPGWEAWCQLWSAGLGCCAREEDFSLVRGFVNRKSFWKSNMDTWKEIKSQQSAKITCYFQMAYGHSLTIHIISCAQVGLRLPANSKCSLLKNKNPKPTCQADSPIVINIYHIFHESKPKVPK